MQDDDLFVETLMKLGLTLLQAKIYLTLGKLGKAEVNAISKASSIARPDVYRVIPSLEKIGIVEKLISTPSKYQAVSLKAGFSILFKQSEEKNTELKKTTKSLLNNLQGNDDAIPFKTEDTPFIITNGKQLFRRRLEQSIKASQMSDDFVGSEECFTKLLFYNLPQLKKAMDRGVKIRVLTEKRNQKSTLSMVQELKKNPLFKMRYTTESAPVCMIICDDKEFNIRIADETVPSLWSDNPQVLKLAIRYFKSLWNEACNDDIPHENKQRYLLTSVN